MKEVLTVQRKNCLPCSKKTRYRAAVKSAYRVQEYIRSHMYLLPARRETTASQGNRGRRYKTKPGEQYQMDWGFVNIDTNNGQTFRAACFAMMCHHCGMRYVKFFPNAKQENLFIGMIHAFQRLGVPEYILTDNMKSVVNGRDVNGYPIWNHCELPRKSTLKGF